MLRRRAFLSLALAGRGLRLATFSADVTPPLGVPLDRKSTRLNSSH